MMEPPRYDVAIVGAGLVGLALAPALARAGLSVAIVDRVPLAVPEPPPGSWDRRIYAISPGSAAFLDGLGAWAALPSERIEAIDAMDIAGDDGARLAFSAYDQGERALAWIVEERALKAALVPRVHGSGVAIVAPAPIASIDWGPLGATILMESGERLEARLVVGADGVESAVRRAAGIVAEPRPYGQTAVVANFEVERPHRGIARQWFLGAEGILAFLPMPGPRISIVWSAPDALASNLLALDAPAFEARVAERGRHVLGGLRCITPPAAFPLRFLRLRSPVAHRVALVGDAAHGVHPLAGQGVNLGFGDAQVLADVLAQGRCVGDPGAPILLGRYARRRAEPVLAMQSVTDGLARLFGSPGRAARLVRNAGMAAVDRLPLVKRLLAQPALR